MPFEFAFLDWLYQFRNPVMNTISIFFDYAGAHGEIWIAFTLLLLLFRRTRKAGFAMAVALVLYMAAGHFFLKPLFARPRPCDLNTSITMLVARPHGHSFPSGHTASGVAAAYALWLQNRKHTDPRIGVLQICCALFHTLFRVLQYFFHCSSSFTMVPIGSPQMAFLIFSGWSMLNTRIGMLLSLHMVAAVLSITCKF